jgi:hypothetical protein
MLEAVWEATDARGHAILGKVGYLATANSVLAHLFRARPNLAQAATALVDSEQPMRLAPTLTTDDLPAGFEEILEVQVLGYRERLTSLHGGGRQRVLDPVWTLIPKV